jgi:hypothetical protein
MSTDVSEVSAAFIIRAMKEAARTSETSVDIQLRTRQYIPEDSELQVFGDLIVFVCPKNFKFIVIIAHVYNFI